MPSIDCRDLSLRYGDRLALAGLNLSVPEGSWVTLMGPSGSGKSTLLRVVAGLVAPLAGEVRFGGEVVSRAGRVLTPPHLRRVAFLFQEPALWSHLSARANVMLGMDGRRDLGRAGKRANAMAALDRVGLADRAAAFPSELSGGEAQRVALARALVAGASILLLDEPVAHLDLHLRDSLMREIRRLHIEEGWTTLCVTHQPDSPVDRNDRVVIIESGGIQFDGDFDSVPKGSPSAFVSMLGEHLATRISAEERR